MDEALRRTVADVVGSGGISTDAIVMPANVVQLREVLGLCAQAGLRVAAAGSAAAPRADVLVAADRLDSIRMDASTLLLHAGAAATWVALQVSASAVRLAVSGLGPVRSQTVGASVHGGEISHRTLVGVDLLTARGELISAGGRTLKDVVGYDLAGLILGSGERLGLVVAVTLRLEPAAARTPATSGPGPWRADAGLDAAVVAAFSG